MERPAAGPGDLEAPLLAADAFAPEGLAELLEAPGAAGAGGAAAPPPSWTRAPGLALLLMGWSSQYFALPASERPCTLGCMRFECAALLAVLAQALAAYAALAACLLVGLLWAQGAVAARGALGLASNIVFVLVGLLYLLHVAVPEHLDPFWDSVPAALAAPQEVVSALSADGLHGLAAAGRGGAWRPLLWGSIWWYRVAFGVLVVFWFYGRWYVESLRALRPILQERGFGVFGQCGLGVLGCICLTLFAVAISGPYVALDTWTTTCPLMRPVWLYLHSCIWALGAYLSSSETGPAPEPDQWLGLFVLTWFLLAMVFQTLASTLAAQPPLPKVPFFANKFDENAFLKGVMEKGVFRANMDPGTIPLTRSLSNIPLVRKLSTFLKVEAECLESKRKQLKSGSIASHGGKVNTRYSMGPVVREDLLETSLRLLRTASVEQLLSTLFVVSFQGERGVDMGGVTRDWFDSLAKELAKGSEQHERKNFDDLYSSSLLACATDGTLLPRPSGYTDVDCSEAPKELQERWAQLAAVGRFLGVAVLEGRPLPLSFGKVLMKLLCGRAVSYGDVRHLDNDFYRHRIVGLLEEGGVEKASAAILEPLTFVSAATDLMPEQVPLKKGGDKILVTEENKMEYIGLLSEARICNGRRHELQFFISGFHEVIPVDVLRQAEVSPAELSLLISGVHEYNVDDWRQHAVGTGDGEALVWFWETVASFSEQRRALLLHFSTGSSRIPPGGFGDMKPRFQVCITGESQERMPSAHTCFNQLDIPKYGSKEMLAEKLLLAISETEGFGFA